MTYEDFTTYTEVDEQSDITIDSSTKISVDTMRRDVNSHVSKDYGANHFGNFTHLFDANYISADPSGGYASMGLAWALSNNSKTYQAMVDNAEGIVTAFYRSSSSPYDHWIFIRNMSDLAIDIYNSSTTAPGQKYFKITRSGTTLTLYIYSDAARTTLVDTLIVTCASTQYKYLMAVASWDYATGSTIYITYNVENLDINEDPCSVTTGAASDIAQETATLNGTLDSMGDETSVDVTFEYGETVAYGSETTGSTENSAGAIAEGISGLSASTTYHFRIKAVGVYGTVYGDDATFDTLAAPTVAAKKLNVLPFKLGLPTPVNIGV